MARAVLSNGFGPPDSYRLEEQPRAALGPGEIRVAIRAAGVSYVDVLLARGEYQVKPPLPYIPGSEFSGEVLEVGSQVSGFEVGDRVVASSFGGGFAEELVTDARSARKMPTRMSFEEGAIFGVSYTTVYHALVQRGALQAGETVVVLGAAGAIGIAAIQLAKTFGATVIASASTPEKRELTQRCGADHALDSAAPDWRDQIKALTGGRGVDLVVDPVGGELTERAFRSLAWQGRHLVIGFATGTIPALPTNLALLKGASLVGVDIRQFGIFEPERADRNTDAVFELYDEGNLHPPIGQTFPLARYAEAMNAVWEGRIAGRVVLTLAG